MNVAAIKWVEENSWHKITGIKLCFQSFETQFSDDEKDIRLEFNFYTNSFLLFYDLGKCFANK